MENIIRRLEKCLEKEQTAVIATIIKIEGSSYQPVGSRCLILDNGEIIGLVSGGCVEQDLLERLTESIRNFKAETFYFDFRSKNDLLWGMGLGCDGAVTILLQPFDPINHLIEAKELYEQLKMNNHTESSFTVATVIKSNNENYPVGMMKILDEKDTNHLQKPLCTPVTLNGEQIECFIEIVNPRPHVTIFGAGPDVVPVVEHLIRLNWQVMVIDHRPQYLHSEYFPKTTELVLTSRNGYEEISLKQDTHVVIMTHNFEIDICLIRKLIQEDKAYIGVLGAKNRIYTIFAELEKEGITRVPEGRIHSPIGLDIGAKSPEEISISIVAELIAIKNLKTGDRRVVRDITHTYC